MSSLLCPPPCSVQGFAFVVEFVEETGIYRFNRGKILYFERELVIRIGGHRDQYPRLSCSHVALCCCREQYKSCLRLFVKRIECAGVLQPQNLFRVKLGQMFVGARLYDTSWKHFLISDNDIYNIIDRSHASSCS
ncbi:hypothetical protein Tco_0223661 [Tanacetum coccineum]